MKKVKKSEVVHENNKKLLFKMYNIWARNLWDENIIFFSITINLGLIFNISENDAHREDCLVENWSEVFLDMLVNIHFIEVIHGSIEEGEKGFLLAHCLLGFRSHFNIVPFIRIQLDKWLVACGDFEFFDYKLVYLNNYREVMRSLDYIIKDFDKKRKFAYAFTGVYSHIFKEIHSKLFIPLIDGNIVCVKSTFISYRECYSLNSNIFHIFPGKLHDIAPISKRQQREEITEIVYYLAFYFHKNDCILYKNNLYSKKKGWSNDMLGILEEFINEQIFNILIEIKTKFDFIKIQDLRFLFYKHYKVVIKKLLLFIKTQKYSFNVEGSNPFKLLF